MTKALVLNYEELKELMDFCYKEENIDNLEKWLCIKFENLLDDEGGDILMVFDGVWNEICSCDEFIEFIKNKLKDFNFGGVI